MQSILRHLLPITVVALALSACGDEGPSDEQAVRDTLKTFATSVEKRDYQTLCDDVFAPELLEGLQQIGLPCEIAMKTSFEEVEEPKLTVGAITVEKATATAEVRTSAKGQAPSSDVVELSKLKDGWKVSALSAAPDGGATATASPTP